MDCVMKHLGQACVLEIEAINYPIHKFLCIGHLAEAEAECMDKHPDFAAMIRDARIGYDNGVDFQILFEYGVKIMSE